MQMLTGTILRGKVSAIVPFGAFVEIEKGKSGLVHISEVSDEYVEDIKNYLKVGQEVDVKVLSVDTNGKISLSIKRASKNSKKTDKQKTLGNINTNPPEEFDFNAKKREMESMSFEDKILKFKHDSEEKFQQLKRSADGKRSGGYKRTY